MPNQSNSYIGIRELLYQCETGRIILEIPNRSRGDTGCVHDDIPDDLSALVWKSLKPLFTLPSTSWHQLGNTCNA